MTRVAFISIAVAAVLVAWAAWIGWTQGPFAMAHNFAFPFLGAVAAVAVAALFVGIALPRFARLIAIPLGISVFCLGQGVHDDHFEVKATLLLVSIGAFLRELARGTQWAVARVRAHHA